VLSAHRWDHKEIDKAGNFVDHFLETVMPGVTVMLKKHQMGGARIPDGTGTGGGGGTATKKAKT
jgi:hypothetical protein